jgi:transposase
MLRMDQVHVIRHKVLVEGRSVRQVAREMGVSRNTVRRYLSAAAPVRVEKELRPRPVWDKVHARIDAVLGDAPRWTGGKQRLTAARLHRMLLAEGHRVGITLVREEMAEWKRRRREVFVPLVYSPGELAEVDFFEVLVDVAGARRKAWMFVMRLMASGTDFVWLYDRQDQVSFLDGHVRAFAFFGAVPQRIAYDNLKAAVTRVVVGSERQLNGRFEALASHYLFEPAFCRPRTGHDKGGVEARGKALRCQHLVPIPVGDDLGAIRAALLARVADEQKGRIDSERSQMLPLPERPFDPRWTRSVPVSRRALFVLEGATYSAPCRWAGLDVVVHVGPDELEIVGPDGAVTRHRGRFGERVIDYRDYLRELATKPQAVRQVAAPLVRDLGEPFGAAWRSLVDAHGPKQAARIFAKVLGHVETRGAREVADRIALALERDESLLLALAPPAPAPSRLGDELLPAPLRELDVERAAAADYDVLLAGGDS